jgi:hypothetical protein
MIALDSGVRFQEIKHYDAAARFDELRGRTAAACGSHRASTGASADPEPQSSRGHVARVEHATSSADTPVELLHGA